MAWELSAEAAALVRALIAQRPSGGAVAFDADGTLWRGDVGEELLRHLAAEQLLPRRRGRGGVFDEYERRVAEDPADAYAFAVRVMADLPEAQLEELCAQFFARRFRGRVFRYVGALLAALSDAGFEPWVVSASPVWPVRAGAKTWGLPPERVIGVECERAQGRLTERVLLPIPCGEGKVRRLEERGVRPVLAVGNGELDLPMLAYAERAMVVAPPGEDNLLVQAARTRGWPVHRC
jgi:phosphatidylglycerophosphatase C